jgi:hypothetical protein
VLNLCRRFSFLAKDFMDSIKLKGQVTLIRHSRIAVVRIENDQGDEFDIDIPVSMLPPDALNGTRLEIGIAAEDSSRGNGGS